MCLQLPNQAACQIMPMCRDFWGILQALFELLQAAALGVFLTRHTLSLNFVFP